MSAPRKGEPRTVTLSGLRKSFGAKAAVDGLDLEVAAGAIVALLGPSGCGKTTTLRMIAGLEKPDAGTIMVGDRTLNGGGEMVPPERRRIGMVFQDYALFPHLDVAGNVAYALGRGADASRVEAALELVGLGGYGGRPVHELSGGEQQRVALARALVAGPELLLLDEPFSNLDASLRERLRSEVRGILGEAGVTTLFVTHDQEEALSLADSVAVINAGRLEQVGSPEEVYTAPSSHWVADFLGDVDVLRGTAGGGQVECELGTFPTGTGLEGPVDVLVRPEAVGISTERPATSASTHQGTIRSRTYFGHDQLLEVELRSGTRLRARRMSWPTWHEGDAVRVWLEGPANVLPSRQADET